MALLLDTLLRPAYTTSPWHKSTRRRLRDPGCGGDSRRSRSSWATPISLAVGRRLHRSCSLQGTASSFPSRSVGPEFSRWVESPLHIYITAYLAGAADDGFARASVRRAN